MQEKSNFKFGISMVKDNEGKYSFTLRWENRNMPEEPVIAILESFSKKMREKYDNSLAI